jgi:hypothetical protein
MLDATSLMIILYRRGVVFIMALAFDAFGGNGK